MTSKGWAIAFGSAASMEGSPFKLATMAASLKGKDGLKAPMCLNPGLDRGLAFIYAQGGSLVSDDGKTDQIDSPQTNAFSGPGGYIFVTTGALRGMKDESELAGVLAHEIAHEALRSGEPRGRQAIHRDDSGRVPP